MRKQKELKFIRSKLEFLVKLSFECRLIYLDQYIYGCQAIASRICFLNFY